MYHNRGLEPASSRHTATEASNPRRLAAPPPLSERPDRPPPRVTCLVWQLYFFLDDVYPYTRRGRRRRPLRTPPWLLAALARISDAISGGQNNLGGGLGGGGGGFGGGGIGRVVDAPPLPPYAHPPADGGRADAAEADGAAGAGGAGAGGGAGGAGGGGAGGWAEDGAEGR